jgi:acetyl-CoA carboxylase biotin carboxylase subunit
LKVANIIAAAEITNADAIHPGYGFLSENARFSKICEEHGIKFIGASPEMIDRMGDKANAKATMKAAGVPCVPGSDGVIQTFEECKKTAKKTGYPVMLKASAGGGGKGMRAVWKEENLKDAWDSARQESKAAFGNDDMYMEKLIEEPRHIEIQIVGDSNGKACHLSERDCSVQRRHQKLTEEVPSPFMTDALRKKMGEAAVKAAEFIKYEGAGTVEFLVDKHRNFYFMEMNTRIQVEHPITEQVIDFDLIREQILVASGVAISGKNYFPNLHSIECRINAEDPFNDFRPSPGKITTLHSPGGHGVRLDTHVYAGYVIPPNYDSMIAKLITTAQTREEAINKMKRALDEFVIEGIKTTIPFHRQLMEHPDYVAGNYTTKFMEDFVIETSN